MRQRTAAEERTARPRLRKLAGSALVLLIVLLPVLLAFARIDTAPSTAEIARVEQAMFAERSQLSEPLLMFYGSAIPESALQRWPAEQQRITIGARIAGMLALFAISALLYLLLLLVRGRATAAAGCLCLCLLPSIGEEGYVLRPELCATLFGLLGVVLIAGFPVMLQRRGGGLTALLARTSLLIAVGLAFGIAQSSLGVAWIYLAIPAAALLLSVMALGLMFPRATRGREFVYWPFRAAARRYLPWMFLVLCSATLMLFVLLQLGGVEPVSPSRSRFGLLPENAWLALPLVALAAVGALRMALGVGLRIGRLRRVRPDTVLFLYVAALMMQYFLAPAGSDTLPTAVALACLVSDGVMTLAVLGVGYFIRWNSGG